MTHGVGFWWRPRICWNKPPNFYLHNQSGYDNIYMNREESFHQWKGASRFFICHKSSLMDFQKPLYELLCVTMKVKKCHRPCLLIGSGETLATGIGACRDVA